VGLFREAGVVVNRTERVGILHQRAKNFIRKLKRLVISNEHFNFERVRTVLDDFDGLRMAGFGDEENVAILFEPVRHRHRFGGGGGFVEHRGIGEVEAGEFTGHCLEIQKRFEAALGNLGLIRRVLRIPAGIFEHAALDDRRCDGVVIAHADKRAENLVLAGDAADFGKRVKFAAGGGQV
jgi:hypothetical protein